MSVDPILSRESLLQLPPERLVGLILELRDIKEEQSQLVVLLLEQIEQLKQQIKELKGQKPKSGKCASVEAPDWVKPNKPAPSPKPRKKRSNAFVRRRERPSREVVHACSHCPDCGRTLAFGWESSRRQVIELPAMFVEVIDHISQARRCGVCQKTYYPSIDLSSDCVGQSRFGIRVHALVGYLRQVCRMPIRAIRSLLCALCGLKVSTGEVERMLCSVANAAKPFYEQMRELLRQSAYVHGDETGWREDGQNGYLWCFSTSELCYFTYPKTRAGHVVTDVLGEEYKGVLCSDFYAGYNTHLGLHQRCWVHLLRDVHELVRRFPTRAVKRWAKKLRRLYDKAKAFHHKDARMRAKARVLFQDAIRQLAAPYETTNLPQSTLARRLLQFESEMFTFVEYPSVPSQNNAAERAVRPRVIARKISGGTRSDTGSQTMVVLSSIYATWQLRGHECLAACIRMLKDAQAHAAPEPA